jgi:hypothetical protein
MSAASGHFQADQIFDKFGTNRACARFTGDSYLTDMGVTPVDLYRSGNSTSPNLDRVRTTGPDRDVDSYVHQGSTWIEANGKGVSTEVAPNPSWRGRPWRLPAGSRYPDELLVWPDEPGHYSWAPAKDMTLEDYKAALLLAGKGFLKAWTV